MNRKEFLRLSGCCAAAALLQRASGATPAASTPSGTPPPASATNGPPLTAPEKRAAWGEIWAKRFFDVLDSNLDEATRVKIMQANGRACFEGSLNGDKSQPPTLNLFIKRAHAWGGDKFIRREGDTVYFNYIQNPNGLKVADGYCLCPLVETGPAGLSGTFCFCSVGYVEYMFERMVGHPVKVTLLESLKRGGNACRFKIELNGAA